jgi:hypothetical protein
LIVKLLRIATLIFFWKVRPSIDRAFAIKYDKLGSTCDCIDLDCCASNSYIDSGIID